MKRIFMTCALSVLLAACGGSDDAKSTSDGGGAGNSGGSGNSGNTDGGNSGGGGNGGTAGGSNTGGSNTGGSNTGGTSSGGSGNSGGASTDGGGALCPGLGWCELTNTKLADVCPDETQYSAIQGYEGCSGVINDWSGGMGDSKRNRLVVWGGGHHGYFGNEVYALDLNTVTMQRLNEPSDVAGYDFNDCYAPDEYPDGRPASRHTYDALAYISHADKMFSFTGAKAPCGYSSDDLWILDMATVETAPLGPTAPWKRVYPTGGSPKAAPGEVADYDPVSKQVILGDLYSLWSFDYDGNKFTELTQSAGLDYHMTGRVDPKRHLFVVAGNGSLVVFDIASGKNHAAQDWTSQVTGCGFVSEIYPGLAYDSKQDKMVGWAGGDDVFVLDLDKKSCTKTTFGGGPGPQNSNGTMGRFRYFESLDVFAVVSDVNKDAYTLRLSP